MLPLPQKELTSKGSRIITNPFDGQPLISQPQILSGVRTSWKTKDVDTVVDCDDHNVFVLCQTLAIVEVKMSITSGKTCK